jgi:NADH dehydrogenase FAD-containing subunit
MIDAESTPVETAATPVAVDPKTTPVVDVPETAPVADAPAATPVAAAPATTAPPVTTSLAPGQKSVVIVGGGYGGSTLAHKLKGSKGLSVTVINPSEFGLYKPASLRAAVLAGDWSSNTLVPVTSAGDKLVVGAVASVDDSAKTVTLEDGQVVKYDTLVLATGARTRGPGWVPLGSTLDSAKAMFESTKAEFDKAKKVVVIGGGPTGIELAAEVAEAHPEAKVTLVHSGKELLEASSDEKLTYNKKFHRVLNQEVRVFKQRRLGVVLYRFVAGQLLFRLANCVYVCL